MNDLNSKAIKEPTQHCWWVLSNKKNPTSFSKILLEMWVFDTCVSYIFLDIRILHISIILLDFIRFDSHQTLLGCLA